MRQRVRARPFLRYALRSRHRRGDGLVPCCALFDYIAVLICCEIFSPRLADVWGWTVGDAATVTVHMRRLREKAESDPSQPRHLCTVRGVGYRFEP